MAHMIEGNSMAYAGAVPWHGIGTKVDDADTLYSLNWEVFCEKAGLNWEVSKVAMMTSEKPYEIVQSHRVIRRNSDNKHLGVVGADFEPVQNHDRFRWFDPFIESGQAHYETAMSLKGGAQIVVLAKIVGADALVRANDEVSGYIMLAGGFDGSLRETVGFTPIRVVCNNTLQAAKSASASQLIRVKHTKNVHRNLENIRETMDIARQQFVASMEQYKLLCNKAIKRSDIEKYVKIVFEVDKEKPEDLSTRTKNQIDKVVSLAINGKGNSGETLWDAYNGLTEWMSWERGNEIDSRMQSVMFGDSAKMNARALEVGLEMAAA